MTYQTRTTTLSFLLFSLISSAACTILPYEEQYPNDLLSPLESINTSNPKFLKKTFAKDDNFVVLVTKKEDTLNNLAQRYLGDENLSWMIKDFNRVTRIVPGVELVIPLKHPNPFGVYVDGTQTIPILCYHRFGDGHKKMSVSKNNFRSQMKYLKDNQYSVVTLRQLGEFLKGKKELPRKSVVITVDDGYRSTFDIALPILKEFGFAATVFLYTDFLGAPDALNWIQIRKMRDSGVFDFQAHSKSHPNLVLMRNDANEYSYQELLNREISYPKTLIEKKLNTQIYSFAYPFGDTSDDVIDMLKTKGFSLATTVQPGTNPVFSSPFMLRRTMIYGDDSLSDFRAALQTFEPTSL